MSVIVQKQKRFSFGHSSFLLDQSHLYSRCTFSMLYVDLLRNSVPPWYSWINLQNLSNPNWPSNVSFTIKVYKFRPNLCSGLIDWLAVICRGHFGFSKFEQTTLFRKSWFLLCCKQSPFFYPGSLENLLFTSAYHKEKHLYSGKIALRALLRITVPYLIAETKHYFMGKTIVPLDFIFKSSCRPLRKFCSLLNIFSVSMSSIELTKCWQFVFFLITRCVLGTMHCFLRSHFFSCEGVLSL